MREYLVSRDERGQRLDKYLKRRLPQAPSSFIYKMLRKKNITLQGKKADGSEKVEEGDRVVLFLSDETIEKFSAPTASKEQSQDTVEEERAYRELSRLLGRNPVLYEDEDILIVTKPAGVLSQKAAPGDLSMNEWLRGYLHQKKEKKDSDRQASGSGFRPSVCNRLDRNTGGILLCAKSLQGSRDLSEVIRERKIRKTYRMVVHGRLTCGGVIEGDLIKDLDNNLVTSSGQAVETFPPEKEYLENPEKDFSEKKSPEKIFTTHKSPGQISFKKSEDRENSGLKRRRAVTVYRPVLAGRKATLVEADLITGRSHQLRVHMASIGHPILFDPKYGDRNLDRVMRESKESKESKQSKESVKKSGRTRGQLLWCRQIEFPDRQLPEEGRPDVLAGIRGRIFTSPEPAWWKMYLS